MRLKLSDAEIIREQITEIEYVVPRNQTQKQVVRKFLDGNYNISGDYPLLNEVTPKDLLYGRFINGNDIDLARKIAIISQDVYEQLFEKDEYPIGEFIEISKINYKVVGVRSEERRVGKEC